MRRGLMQTYQETGKITASASKAGLDRKTAAKYIHGAPGPGQRREQRFRACNDNVCLKPES